MLGQAWNVVSRASSNFISRNCDTDSDISEPTVVFRRLGRQVYFFRLFHPRLLRTNRYNSVVDRGELGRVYSRFTPSCLCQPDTAALDGTDERPAQHNCYSCYGAATTYLFCCYCYTLAALLLLSPPKARKGSGRLGDFEF